MKRKIKNTIVTLAIPTILYAVFLIISFERFYNWNTLYTILLQSIIPTIIAYGVAFGNICGIFDFTIGSRLIITGIACGMVSVQFGMPGLIISAFAISFLLAALTGALNWVCKIPSLVLTMGLTMVFEIVGKQLAGNFGFISLKDEYTFLGSRTNMSIILIVCAILFYIIFNNTKFSYDMRAIGSNEVVAKNAGIKTNLTKFKTFFYGGFFIAIAAILTISQSGSISAQTSLGSATLLFKPLISILLALAFQKSCNLTIGIFISQLSLNIIFIGLIAAGMNDTFQNVVLGAFLLVVMLLFENIADVTQFFNKFKNGASNAQKSEA